MVVTTWLWLWSSCHYSSSTFASSTKIQKRSSLKPESLSSSSLQPHRSGASSIQSLPGFLVSPWKATGTSTNLRRGMAMDLTKLVLLLLHVCTCLCLMFGSCFPAVGRIRFCRIWLTNEDIIHGACNMLIDIAVLAIPVFSKSMWTTADEQLRSRIAMIGLYALGGL